MVSPRFIRPFAFLAAALLFSGIVACDSSEDPVSAASDLNPYEYVGLEHNEGLDHALESIRQNGGIEVSEIGSFSEGVTMGYISQREESGLLSQSVMYEIVRDEIARSSVQSNARTFSGGSGLNEAQQPFVDRLYAGLDDMADAEDYRAIVDQIVRDAGATLTEEDEAVVLAAAAVAANSVEYWEDNFEEWADALQAESAPAQARQVPDWLKRIGANDLGGAIGGAIAGAIGGPKGAGLGALGGGVGASVATGVCEAINC